MLFMILIKASVNSENGQLPSLDLREKMNDYNEELETRGVRVMAKGLHPTKEAIRYSFQEPFQKATISKGPFTPTHDQLAGFFLIEVSSLDEAMYWAEKVPDPQGDGEGIVELREVF